MNSENVLTEDIPLVFNRRNTPESKPGLEKSDSCYDSDENEEECLDPAGGVTKAHRNSESSHRDVSRTFSETLKEECESSSTNPALPLDIHPLYRVHLAFAVKLGFTEENVQRALQKLGNQVTQNELLAELISLGAGSCMEEKCEEEDISGPPVGSHTHSAGSCASSDFPIYVDPLVGSQQKAFASNQCDAIGSVSSLRHVVIDGSNVAMSHGNKVLFSCRGIQLCVDYFRQRGHKDITVFVPQWRKETSKPDAPIKDQEILLQLEREGLLTFTPSRYVGKRRLVCYDDRYIIKLAVEVDGVVVSNDTYRDLIQENVDYRKVVEERLLMYSFVNDRFMPPDDPLGRHGPTLEHFLKKTKKRNPEFPDRLCPYGKKCTYGNKCKYAHPERGNQPQKSVAEAIEEKAKAHLQEMENREFKYGMEKAKLTATLSSPVPRSPTQTHKTIHRTRSNRFQGDQSSSGVFNPMHPNQPASARFLRVPSPAPLYRPASVDTAEGLVRQIEQQMYLQAPHQNGHLGPAHNRSLLPGVQTFSGQQHMDLSGTNSSPMNAAQRSHRPLGPALSDQGPDGNSMHNKVARQLSLNPYGESQGAFRDVSRRGSVNPIAQVSSRTPGDMRTQPGQFRPLTNTRSTEPAYPYAAPFNQYPFHSVSSENVYNQKPVPSSSFFLSSPHSVLPSPRDRASTMDYRSSFRENPAPSPFQSIVDSQRMDIFSRLCTLFPQNQVQTAMACYPNECNVHKLCSVILQLFPVGEDN